jgi:hypothetical protein
MSHPEYHKLQAATQYPARGVRRDNRRAGVASSWSPPAVGESAYRLVHVINSLQP